MRALCSLGSRRFLPEDLVVGTRVTMIRRFLLRDLKKGGGKTRVQGQGGLGVSSRRSAARDRLIPLNCVELRRIIFSILGKRQLNGPDRTATCNAPQGHTKPHKADAETRIQGIQGVSDRRSYEERRKKFELAGPISC